jgi:hypothetical protein
MNRLEVKILNPILPLSFFRYHIPNQVRTLLFR